MSSKVQLKLHLFFEPSWSPSWSMGTRKAVPTENCYEAESFSLDLAGFFPAGGGGHIENLEKSAIVSTKLEISCNKPTRFSRSASSCVRISTLSNN